MVVMTRPPTASELASQGQDCRLLPHDQPWHPLPPPPPKPPPAWPVITAPAWQVPMTLPSPPDATSHPPGARAAATEWLIWQNRNPALSTLTGIQIEPYALGFNHERRLL